MREAQVSRKTTETEITVKLNIDGEGKTKIDTPIGLLNHMLELFAFHGLFDLEITAKGDSEKIDIHHTNEDVGIVLGQAFKKALRDKAGIKRIGFASVPMEEVVANATVDISGRGSFRLNISPGHPYASPATSEGYELKDSQHFFEALAKHLGINLNITVNPVSKDLHTTLEPIFKALGLAMKEATEIDPRRKGIPSTKGVID